MFSTVHITELLEWIVASFNAQYGSTLHAMRKLFVNSRYLWNNNILYFRVTRRLTRQQTMYNVLKFRKTWWNNVKKSIYWNRNLIRTSTVIHPGTRPVALEHVNTLQQYSWIRFWLIQTRLCFLTMACHNLIAILLFLYRIHMLLCNPITAEPVCTSRYDFESRLLKDIIELKFEMNVLKERYSEDVSKLNVQLENSEKQIEEIRGNYHCTVLVLIKLTIFSVSVRFRCSCSNLIVCLYFIIHHFLRYLRTLYIVWSLVRRRVTRRLTRL